MSLRTNTSFAELDSVLRHAERIALVSHIRPDADAVGSILGLGRSLCLERRKVHFVLEDGVPENLAFLPGADLVLKPGSDPIMDLDVAVALDTATHDRIGEGCQFVLGGARKWINIDHHGSNPAFGDLHYIDTGSPATGQIIYELLQQQGLPMDDEVRQNLFAAISTDTGSFQFASTTARSHRIAAEMIEDGLDIANLCRLLYHTFPRRRFELQKAMLNEMRFRSHDRIVSWILTRTVMHQAAMRPGDTEGLIDVLRSVDSVIAAVIFEELEDGKIRVSARSKDARLNVAGICAQFGGGGHAMAAGARIKGTPDEAAETFLRALEHEVERIA